MTKTLEPQVEVKNPRSGVKTPGVATLQIMSEEHEPREPAVQRGCLHQIYARKSESLKNGG